MLQATIPAGTHMVELHYWPEAFTAGLVIAGVTVIMLLSVPVGGRWRRRHRQNPADSASSSG
jgi:uncharacterized membrane protein YfhO